MLQGGSIRVLACFVTSEVYGFVELCELAGYAPDLGGYYIRQLLKDDYLTRAARGQYRISAKGRHYLSVNYGKKTSELLMRPRLNVLVVARAGKNYVLLERMTQPFIGAFEWPATAVGAAESIEAAVERLLRERLGIDKYDAELRGFFRRTDFYKDAVFDDKLFAVHAVTLPEDTLTKEHVAQGRILFRAEEELRTLPRPSRSFVDILEYVRSDRAHFEARVYHLRGSDLSLAAKQD